MRNDRARIAEYCLSEDTDGAAGEMTCSAELISGATPLFDYTIAAKMKTRERVVDSKSLCGGCTSLSVREGSVTNGRNLPLVGLGPRRDDTPFRDYPN